MADAGVETTVSPPDIWPPADEAALAASRVDEDIAHLAARDVAGFPEGTQEHAAAKRVIEAVLGHIVYDGAMDPEPGWYMPESQQPAIAHNSAVLVELGRRLVRRNVLPREQEESA